MTLAVRLLVGVLLAAATTYLVTPYAIRLAERLQFYDHPAGYKGHARPTPYLGGVAVMAGLVLAVCVSAGSWDKTGPLLGGVLALWVIGTIDDRRSLSPAFRLAAELGLGVLIWAVHLGWDLHVGGAVDLVLTCLWTVAIVNAFNLFDNMDGAAGAMALVVCLGAGLIGVVQGDVWLAATAASMCGACLGFLPRNISVPARIFLGDGGSMPVGFAVAVLVMTAGRTSPVHWRGLLVALLLVGVPLLDTGLVIVSRRRRGVSVLLGGRDHLTHRALTVLPNARAVALLLGAVQAALSVLALLASRGEASLVVLGASGYMLLAGIAISVLDTRTLEQFQTTGERSDAGRWWASKRALACLAGLGLGAGLSPLWFTYYDTSVWVPIGLGVTVLCAVALVIRPARPARPAILGVGGLLGLGVWSLGSAAWAESTENAVISANRWLALGAALMLMLLLVSHERRALVLLVACALGIAIVAGSVVVRMLSHDAGSLFLDGRLNSPLGYINGEGCLFAMALWPAVALAEVRRAPLAALGAALAVVFASLALLSQSRGTALAVLGSLLVMVALVPGRTRRLYAIAVVAGAVALAGPSLLHVYDRAGGGAVSLADAHAAARAMLLAALGAGVLWGFAAGAWEHLRSRSDTSRLARAASLVLVLAAVAGIAFAATRPLGSEARRQWHAFVHLTETGENRAPGARAGNSRLLTGSGNRYDYWRIAWRVWRHHPLIGVGAGNYPRSYFEQRATAEDVDQPHSLQLQVLSELGLVGVLLLAAFLAGVAWGAWRTARTAGASPLRRWVAITATGFFSAWLTQTSVDWMHLLPGLTAVALAGAAALIWPRGAPVARRAAPERPGTRRPLLAAGIAAVAAILIVTGASLSRQGLADIYRTRAQDELARNPRAALADIRRSLNIDADSTRSYYIRAAVLARFDQPGAARAALLQALAREPRSFVTWALLGDVAVRRRRIAEARADYTRAYTLNPREPGLLALARNPLTALS